MKEKIKKIILGYLPGFLTGLIICGSISVIAATYFPSNNVTYDNTESGLSSNDVQGAIDELYGVCFPKPAGEQIIEDAGLEKDPYECRYFYKGGNPNNYITFNGEEAGWRIISVECDGTIKIIKDESIGEMKWNKDLSNNWSKPVDLNTYLNGTYYSGLNSTAQNQIVAKDFSIGSIGFSSYNIDLETNINNENSKKWNGKIGLITVSEYIRTNSNTSKCGSTSLLGNNVDLCKNTNWLFVNGEYWWTLTPFSNYEVIIIYPNGSIGYNQATWETRPTLYLSSDIKITGGDGSQNNPYTLG